MGDQRVAVALGHDFALLGHPQAAGDGGRRQRKHGLGRRTAAAAQGPAAAVEEADRDVELLGQPGQPLLGVVKLPVGRDVAAVLDAVGIADHADLVPAQTHRDRPGRPAGANMSRRMPSARRRSSIVSSKGMIGSGTCATFSQAAPAG